MCLGSGRDGVASRALARCTPPFIEGLPTCSRPVMGDSTKVFAATKICTSASRGVAFAPLKRWHRRARTSAAKARNGCPERAASFAQRAAADEPLARSADRAAVDPAAAEPAAMCHAAGGVWGLRSVPLLRSSRSSRRCRGPHRARRREGVVRLAVCTPCAAPVAR